MEVKSGQLSVERREFLRKMGGMAIMGAFGTAFFTACGTDDDVTPGTQANPGGGTGIAIDGNIVTINTAQQASLNNDGAWLLIPQAQLLVFNDGGIRVPSPLCVPTVAATGTGRSVTGSSFVRATAPASIRMALYYKALPIPRSGRFRLL